MAMSCQEKPCKAFSVITAKVRVAKLKAIQDSFLCNSKRKFCYKLKTEIQTLITKKSGLQERKSDLKKILVKEEKNYNRLLLTEIEMQNSTRAINAELLLKESMLSRKKQKRADEIRNFQSLWRDAEMTYKGSCWFKMAQQRNGKCALALAELESRKQCLKDGKVFATNILNNFRKGVISFSEKIMKYKKIETKAAEQRILIQQLVQKIKSIENSLSELAAIEQVRLEEKSRFVLYEVVDVTMDSAVSPEVQEENMEENYEIDQPFCLSLDVSLDHQASYNESIISNEPSPSPALEYISTSTPYVPTPMEPCTIDPSAEIDKSEMIVEQAQTPALEPQAETDSLFSTAEESGNKRYEKSPNNSDAIGVFQDRETSESGNKRYEKSPDNSDATGEFQDRDTSASGAAPFSFYNNESQTDKTAGRQFSFFGGGEKEGAGSIFNLF